MRQKHYKSKSYKTMKPMTTTPTPTTTGDLSIMKMINLSPPSSNHHQNQQPSPQQSSASSCSSFSSYEAQCTCCSFISDYDTVFRHGVEEHQIYICVCCSTHYTMAKELMVHLYREHRVPPQRFNNEPDFLRAGGQETVLCCIDCSSIFELGSQLGQDDEDDISIEKVFDEHECCNNQMSILSPPPPPLLVAKPGSHHHNHQTRRSSSLIKSPEVKNNCECFI